MGEDFFTERLVLIAGRELGVRESATDLQFSSYLYFMLGIKKAAEATFFNTLINAKKN